MPKKKTERSTKRVSLTDAIGLKKFSNETTDFLSGVLLVLFAIFLIISMTSYLTTGAVDQSVLENLRPGEWLNTNHVFTNYGRSLGAIIAYELITVNFGLSSYLIPVFFVLAGLKLMRTYNVNLWKAFFMIGVVMLWVSVTFAKVLAPLMPNEVYNPGGKHGLLCVQFIENLVGPPGLTAILFFVALAFLTYVSSETIIYVRKAINPVKYLANRVKVTVVMPNHKAKNEDESSVSTDDVVEKHQEAISTPKATLLTVDNASDLSKDGDESADAETENGNTVITSDVDLDRDDTTDTADGEEDGETQVVIQVQTTEKKAVVDDQREIPQFDTPINPKEPFLSYKYPTLDLLKQYDTNQMPTISEEELEANKKRIVEVLNSFGVEIKRTIYVHPGPTVTLYEITPAEGVRINKIRNLEDDIALSLAALGIRIIAPIPGKGTIGIEVPNKNPRIVSMESILKSEDFQKTKMDLPIALGKTITNEVFMVDLAKIPHLLVAGATGQGKSVGLNAIITSLLYKKHPNELKLVLVDPKKVEFSIYEPIADHFMAQVPDEDEEPIITDKDKVVRTLNSLCKLMDDRYNLLKVAGARNLREYNTKFLNHRLDLTKGHHFMPYIVVVIDEFGDLIMTAGKEIELPIARIAQLARAVGIHMVIATQRPTTSIITGNIKANFPGRMAFKVSSMIDSRTILDRTGANQLIGRGDMLFLNGSEPVRVQCAFIDTDEVERVNKYICDQPGPVAPMELPEPAMGESDGGNAESADLRNLDPLFEEAARLIVTSQQGSTSMIQRRFSIGYNRAGRLMDQLEKAGVVGPTQGAKARDVLVMDENALNTLFLRLRG